MHVIKPTSRFIPSTRAGWSRAECLRDLGRGLVFLLIFHRPGFYARLFGIAEILLGTPLFLWDSAVAPEVAAAEWAPAEARGVPVAAGVAAQVGERVGERAAQLVAVPRAAGPAAEKAAREAGPVVAGKAAREAGPAAGRAGRAVARVVAPVAV